MFPLLRNAAKSGFEKNQKKIQNPICKFSKAMLYYETDFFGGA